MTTPEALDATGADSGSIGGALSGLRVLEVAGELGEYCGRLLAGLGADVVKVEPPEGAPSRAAGPFVDDEPHPDRSLAYWADNVGKRSVVVPAPGALATLVGRADVILHDLGPSAASEQGLDYEAVSADRPEVIVCAVTPLDWGDVVR